MLYNLRNNDINSGIFYCSSLLSAYTYKAQSQCAYSLNDFTVNYLYSQLERDAQTSETHALLLQELAFIMNTFPQPYSIQLISTHQCLNHAIELYQSKYDLRTFMDVLQLIYTPILNDTSLDYANALQIAGLLRAEAETWKYYDVDVAENIHRFCDYCESPEGEYAVNSEFIYSLDNMRVLFGMEKLDTHIQITTLNALIIGYLIYNKMKKEDYYNFLALEDLLTLCNDVATYKINNFKTLGLRARNIFTSLVGGMTIKLNDAISELPCLNEFTYLDVADTLCTSFKDAVMEGVRVDYWDRYTYCFELLDHLMETSHNCNEYMKYLFNQVYTY